MSIVNENLGEVEGILSDIITRCNLDTFLSVEEIKMWMTDLESEEKGNMSYLTMLTGLLDKDAIRNKRLMDELISAVIKLRQLMPSRFLDGETPAEKFEKRRKSKEPTVVHLTTTELPPLGWWTYYEDAMERTYQRKFIDAAERFEETFENLLNLETTWREIYRLYCNAGLAHLFSGNEILGVKCLEIAYELNPKYTFAYKQLQDYREGKITPYIQLGILQKMNESIEEWLEGPDYLHLDKVMGWPEAKILRMLSKFGVEVNKKKFIKLAETVYVSDEIAEELFYPQVKKTGKEDEDFIWMAAMALWNIYCPDEPSITILDDAVKKAAEFISKDSKNKSERAYEAKCSQYFNNIQKLVLSDKKGFLAYWSKSFEYITSGRYDLTFFLTSLSSIKAFEKKVFDLVNHLEDQIPHPDWNGVEIGIYIRNDVTAWAEIYKEVRSTYPFHCYIACDVAGFFEEKNDFENAERYLTEALQIVDARAKNKIMSLETTKTTIYEDYRFVFDLLTRLYKRIKVNKAKFNMLEAKMREVEKKSDIYSVSPEMEKLNEGMYKIINKIETEKASTSYAIQYYNYLNQYDINFETKKNVKVDMTPIKIQAKDYGNFELSKVKKSRKKSKKISERRIGRKIGRNEPCPCGSGKKYKKCCEAIGK